MGGREIMVQVVQGKDVTMVELVERFNLRETEDLQFFPEWQEGLPELTTEERQGMDEVKADYRHLLRYPILEPVVKMVILSPLLRLAGFYRPPFYLASESQVEVVTEDEGTVVRGRIDVLVFEPPFWVLLIEAKKIAYSVESAIPQALAYMLANPHPERPAFGMVSNGVEFRFLKLVKADSAIYARSDLFALDSRGDRFTVLQIMKRLGQLVRDSP
jgi:hypothetical protein